MAFGTDAPSASDSKLAMSSSITVPAGGRLYFDIAYEFESDGIGGYFDGGKIGTAPMLGPRGSTRAG